MTLVGLAGLISNHFTRTNQNECDVLKCLRRPERVLKSSRRILYILETCMAMGSRESRRTLGISAGMEASVARFPLGWKQMLWDSRQKQHYGMSLKGY